MKFFRHRLFINTQNCERTCKCNKRTINSHFRTISQRLVFLHRFAIFPVGPSVCVCLCVHCTLLSNVFSHTLKPNNNFPFICYTALTPALCTCRMSNGYKIHNFNTVAIALTKRAQINGQNFYLAHKTILYHIVCIWCTKHGVAWLLLQRNMYE